MAEIMMRKSEPSFAGHHGHELVKVDGAAVVIVDLVDDLFEIVLTERGVDLPEDLLEDAGGDVSITLHNIGWIEGLRLELEASV